MSKQIPKDTFHISAWLKGPCYEGEEYCNSFSPDNKEFVDYVWNDPYTYLCIAFDEEDNDIGDNQEETVKR